MKHKYLYPILLFSFLIILSGCGNALSYFGMMNRSVYFMMTRPCVRNLAYGPQPQQTLDIYLPEEINETKHPVFIFIHGGGWRYGDKSYEAVLLKPYLEQGILGVMINYRLAPEFTFPDQLEDCLLALQWVYKNIKRFRGDPHDLHLAGHSAGAHLSSLVALQSSRLRELGIPGKSLRSCVSLSGVYDLEGPFGKDILRSVNDFIADKRLKQEASPMSLVRDQGIPLSRFFFVVTGSEDLEGLVSQGRRFYDKLLSKGIPSRFLVLEGKDHAEVLQAMGQQGSLLFQTLTPLIKKRATNEMASLGRKTPPSSVVQSHRP
ncbi:MAG: alpha/beta hydrolase [Deltaproteobacteria bacterium]|nr:alpha/beta hydrolase [Deltaproteobacteria bacterium]